MDGCTGPAMSALVKTNPPRTASNRQASIIQCAFVAIEFVKAPANLIRVDRELRRISGIKRLEDTTFGGGHVWSVLSDNVDAIPQREPLAGICVGHGDPTFRLGTAGAWMSRRLGSASSCRSRSTHLIPYSAASRRDLNKIRLNSPGILLVPIGVSSALR